MLIHASCAALRDHGVLLLGPPGAGKSDLLLRLIDRGWALVADDQVELDAGCARPPAPLVGLIEVRGLGILRMAHQAPVRLALAVHCAPGERLPVPARHDLAGVAAVHVDPWLASAPQRVALALDCATGRTAQLAGAFA